MTQNHPKAFGHIKSFVSQRAHMTPSQKDAYDRLMPTWGISYQPQVLDLASCFNRSAPTILEIGFGMGETTLHIAQNQAHHNFLGVEVFPSGVGALLKRIESHQVENIRIIQHDAVEVLRDMIPAGSLAGVHIYFPDPWHKKRHHKRRLIQGPFIELLASRLATGAYIHCATDWENYAEQMLEVLSASALLDNTHTTYAPRPAYRPQTKFETRGLKLGHGVWDLIFKRNATPAPALLQLENIPMQIVINGEPHALQVQTVLELLQSLDYADKRIAVELNGEIVPKSQHATTPLQANDRLEIVVAVGGG